MRVLVVGATGGLGSQFVEQLNNCPRVTRVAAWSRTGATGATARISTACIDLSDEVTIATAAQELGEIDMVIVATGMLSDRGVGIQPEKTWRALDPDVMRRSFEINAIGPALIAKHVLPLLPRDRRAVFAVLSARVGSISDNRLGGWYSYRASKAALNQFIRCFSIELAKNRPQGICVGLHPGTVRTDLSSPFAANVPDGKLFTPEYSVRRMLGVIDGLTPVNSGRVYDWAGTEVPA